MTLHTACESTLQFTTLLIGMFVLGVVTMTAQKTSSQTKSCCGATEEFAALASSKDFKMDHIEPQDTEGNKFKTVPTEIAVANGNPTTVYKLDAEGEPKATILVVHEWWGVNDHILETAQKLFSDLGETVDVVVVDLYDGLSVSTREEAAKAMQNADEGRIRNVLTAVLASIKTNKIGTIGWCFGGGWSLQASMMAGERASACVMYYGMPEKDINKLKKLKAPVLGIFGTKDQWINPTVVKEFQDNMNSAEGSLKIRVYEAEHAFANPSNPQYDVEATADAWSNSLDFFKLHIIGM